MKKSTKIILNTCLVLYAAFYLWAWKLFLDFESFSCLKPYAAVFILSAFTCLMLAKVKKQIPFVSFFVGSTFGPLGVLMLIFSAKDFRNVDLKDRDASFYDEFQNEIEKLRSRISKYKEHDCSGAFFDFIFEVIMGRTKRGLLYHRLKVMEGAFNNLKLDFPFSPYQTNYDVFLALLWNVENALKEERVRNIAK